MKKGRVLIVYYSFTQQTRVLLRRFVEGLKGEGVEVGLERLRPLQPFPFPFKTNGLLVRAMLSSFFRCRLEIAELNPHCYKQWDCVILAGPTWSYHPSGPVLDFLDRFGESVCRGQQVIPFISCRSYWRLHYWQLRSRLHRCGATVGRPIVFSHPIREPWRIIGLVLQLRGKMVRKSDSWFRKHYPGYGHTREQGDQALAEGVRLAKLVQRSEGQTMIKATDH